MRDPSALNVTAETELFIFKFPIHCFVYVENYTPHYSQTSHKQEAQKNPFRKDFREVFAMSLSMCLFVPDRCTLHSMGTLLPHPPPPPPPPNLISTNLF